MNFIEFLTEKWEFILLIIIFIVGFTLRVTSLWKGNIIEWLFAVCADAEKTLGSGTGVLKLRYVYDAFIAKFPVISKYISFNVFSKWVDEALDKLKSKLSENEKLNTLIVGVDNNDSDK